MGFRGVNFAHLAKFNSANSSDFLDMYEAYVDKTIADKNAEPSHRTFAPSSFRCDRRSWFRLRGVQPDALKTIDRTLNFTAEIGTACHRIIQSNLKVALGADWVSVEEFLKENPIPYEYKLEEDEDSLETKIEINVPPLRFACDGIVRWKGRYYLLEIKTSEFASFNDLTDPKGEHIDQVKCYCTILGLDGVLFLYQDRQYGGLKCYELAVTISDKDAIRDRFEYVLMMVEANLAPDPLPKNDPWCSPSRCPYYKKCGEWGR